MQTKRLITLICTALLLFTASLRAQVTNGLQLWLQPEGLTNTVALSKVSYWTNSLGTGNDATNGIIANQPTYLPNALNGRPVLRFLDDGSDVANNPNLNWLVSPLPLSANSNAFTAIIVCESQTTGQRDTLIQQLGSGTTLLYVETNATPATPALVGFASGQMLQSPYAYGVRNWVILALVQDPVAGTQKIYQNGLLLVSTNIGDTTALANVGWLLGCNKTKATHGLNGDIAEVMIYDQALSATDVSNTSYYLAQKFGFVVLTDNFDTPDTFDLEADVATRQSGSAAPAGYYWQSAEIVNNQLKLTIPAGAPGGFPIEAVTPKVNFLTNESGSFQISYDITSYTNSGGIYDGWVGFIMRSQFDLMSPIGEPGSFANIIFYNGGWQDFVSGGMVSGGNPSPVIPPPYHIDIIVQNNIATHIMNGTNVLGVVNLPCPTANKVSLSLGSVQAGLPATATFDNFSFTATPIAPEILPVWSSTLRLADSFTTTDTANLDQDVNTRQTGNAKPIGFVTGGTTLSTVAISGGQIAITNSPTGADPANGMVSPDADFRQLEHLNSYRMKFTAFGANTTANNNTWIGVRWRDTRTGRFLNSGNGGGNGLNLFPDGRWYFHQTSNLVASGSIPVASAYVFEMEVRTNLLRMKINGQPLNLGCGAETYALPVSQAANFVTLQFFAAPSTTGAYATFDNFSFESLEPGFTIPAPVILTPGYTAAGTNSAFTLSVNTTNEIFYAVDSKLDLNGPVWSYLRGFVGNGGLVTVTNASATNALQFYRVRVP